MRITLWPVSGSIHVLGGFVTTGGVSGAEKPGTGKAAAARTKTRRMGVVFIGVGKRLAISHV
jgi:hypothetical protein